MKTQSATLLLIVLICINSVVGFSVQGNKILDGNGNPILLRGVDRCSFEWNSAGQYASQSDYQLMAGWGANVVRLSTNQDFWLVGSSTYSSSYQATIAQQVAWIKAAGMNVILDLHWSDQGNLQISGGANQQAMADVNSVTFWTQVATAYKNDAQVIFELYNEPFVTSWPVWLNGGSSSGYTTVGMQQLYNAVRATGANNTVIIGGINYAFDLSGVASNPVQGFNIVYNTHPYDYSGKQSGDWQAAFGYLAATHPVFMTEFGQYCNTDTYVADLLSYATGLGIHWTAWAWWVSGCSFPSIINDWSGTPTSVGATVKSYLSTSPATGTATTVSGSSSGTQTTTPPTPPPIASTAQVVYDDQLENNWQNYSYTDNVNLANTSPVYAGSKSIGVTLHANGGVYFHSQTAFDFGTYGSLQFFLNGGTGANFASLVVEFYDNSSPPALVGQTVALPKPPAAGTWVLESIPFTNSFGISASQQITGFAIYDTGSATGTIYLDNISLLPASASSTSAAASTSTSVKAATSTSSTTAKAATTSTSAAAASTSVKASTSTTTTGAKPSSTTTTTSGGSGSACSASSISTTQTAGSSWQSGGATITQYAVTITNGCKTQPVVSLTITSPNYTPTDGWGIVVTGTSLSLTSGTTIAASSSYTGWGYQATAQATLTVSAVTF